MKESLDHLEHLIVNKNTFFNFMNENYTIVQYSNLFLRDLQYAILYYFEMKEISITYKRAESLALNYSDHLVSSNELSIIDHKSWKLNFEIGIKKDFPKTVGVENE